MTPTQRQQILAYYPSTRRGTGRAWDVGAVGCAGLVGGGSCGTKTPRVGQVGENPTAAGAIVLAVVASVVWSAIELGAIFLAARAGAQSAMRASRRSS